MHLDHSTRTADWPIWPLYFGYIAIIAFWFFFGALLGWIYNGILTITISFSDLASTLFSLITTIPLAIFICLTLSIILLILKVRKGAFWVAAIPYLLCVLSVIGLTLSFSADSTQSSVKQTSSHSDKKQRKEIRISFDHILVSIIELVSNKSEENKNNQSATQPAAIDELNTEENQDINDRMHARDFRLDNLPSLSLELNELSAWYATEIDIAAAKLETDTAPSTQEVEEFNKRIEILIAELEMRRKAIVLKYSAQ